MNVCVVQVEDEVGEIAMVLVQNKIDLMDEAQIKKWVQNSLVIKPSHNERLCLRFHLRCFDVSRQPVWIVD